MSQYYLTNEKLSLLGIRFKEMYASDGYAYMIDSSFLYSFLQIGIITFLIVTSLHMRMIFYNVKQENRYEMAAITALCLLGLSDPFLFNLSYKNLMFIYIGEWLWILFANQPMPTWNKQIHIITINNFQITINKLRRLNYAISTFKEKCSLLVATYFIITLPISFILCISNWKSTIDSIPDTIIEWEYIRHNIAAGHWIGFFGTLLFFLGLSLKNTKK